MMMSEQAQGLSDLEQQLQRLSHDSHALELIQDFALNLGKTKDRQVLFGAEGVLVCKPIDYKDVLKRGLVDQTENPFALLQGDIVSTESAYLMGERLT